MRDDERRLQTGSDPGFEHKWWALERIAWVVSLVVLILGLAGAFGRGPLSQATLQTREAEVKYERVARFRTPALVQVKLTGEREGHRIILDRPLLDAFRLQQVYPQPVASSMSSSGLEMDFAGRAGQVDLGFECAKIGPIHGSIAIDGGSPLSLNSFGAP